MPDDKSYLPKLVEEVINIAPAAGAATAAVAAPSFRILRTLEVDPYETAAPQSLAEAKQIAAVAGDNFTGSDRKVAKISIAPGAVTNFTDLTGLLASLPKDKTMENYHPPITPAPTTDRVAEEKKNVAASVWLYAASREGDNDFHTILGTDPSKPPRQFMNAEVSWLPAGGKDLNTFKAVRASFASIVQQLPLAGYDFYDPPIPVTVQGSLFFDITHAGGKPTPGPSTAKPKTIWEIHPITSLKPRKV